MLTYLLRRILIAVPTLLGVVLLVFLMVRLAPGDPAILLAEIGRASCRERV